MTELYIYHHLGLGDHILCNAIVRNYAKRYDKIYLFVKPHNYISVKFMYRDLNNIEYIQGDDFIAESIIRGKTNVLKIGFSELQSNISFDRSFYNLVNLDFSKRWDDFYFERDINREIEFFKSFNIEEKKYIFLHDDKQRGYNINRKFINGDDIILSPNLNLTNNIFDYIYIFLNAKEIHCMDSSFRVLIDSLNINNTKLYFHTYVRGNYNFINLAVSKLKWKIIE
jgi:hypothetical protein